MPHSGLPLADTKLRRKVDKLPRFDQIISYKPVKTAFKFRRGAGAILAFLILFVVLASVVGVVFVAMNNPSLRPGAAAYNTCDFNFDGSLDEKDVALVAENFQPDPTQVKPEQKLYDIDKNGAINVLDIQIVSAKNPTYCYVPQEPACVFSPSTVAGGGSVTVSSLGKLFGEVRLAGPATGGGSILLGNLEAGKNPSFTISQNVVPGEYEMRVGSFGVQCRDQSGNPKFRVVSNNQWTLQVPRVSGRTVTFFYSPAAKSDAFTALVVYNQKTGEAVFDSGVLPNGSTSYVWNSAPPGSYRATMFIFGIAIASNTVNFEVAQLNRCDFNKDGRLNSGDQAMMGSNYASKDPTIVQIYDLNGDRVINSGDQAALAQGVRAYPNTTKFCY